MGNELTNSPAENIVWDSSTCARMASELSRIPNASKPENNYHKTLNTHSSRHSKNGSGNRAAAAEDSANTFTKASAPTIGAFVLERTVLAEFARIEAEELMNCPQAANSICPTAASGGCVSAPNPRAAPAVAHSNPEALSDRSEASHNVPPTFACPSPPPLRLLAPCKECESGDHEHCLSHASSARNTNRICSQLLRADSDFQLDPEVPLMLPHASASYARSQKTSQREARVHETAALSGAAAWSAAANENAADAFGQQYTAESISVAPAAAAKTRSSWSVQHVMELVRSQCLPALTTAARLEFIDRLVNGLELLRVTFAVCT